MYTVLVLLSDSCFLHDSHIVLKTCHRCSRAVALDSLSFCSVGFFKTAKSFSRLSLVQPEKAEPPVHCVLKKLSAFAMALGQP